MGGGSRSKKKWKQETVLEDIGHQDCRPEPPKPSVKAAWDEAVKAKKSVLFGLKGILKKSKKEITKAMKTKGKPFKKSKSSKVSNTACS